MPRLQRSSAAVCVVVVLTAAGTVHAQDHDATPEAEATEEPSGVVGSTQAFDDVVPEGHAPRSAQPAASPPPPPPGSALPLPTWAPPNYGYPTGYQPLPAPALDDAPTLAKAKVGYGLQTLALDGLALGLGVLAVSAESSGLASAAALTYLFGGPAVHAGHGKTGTAFGSFGIRVGAPILGAGMGMVLGADCDRSGDDCHSGELGAGLGLILGFGAAIALDAAVLARKDAPAAPSPTVGAVRWVPRVTIEPRRATVGVDAVF